MFTEPLLDVPRLHASSHGIRTRLELEFKLYAIQSFKALFFSVKPVFMTEICRPSDGLSALYLSLVG